MMIDVTLGEYLTLRGNDDVDAPLMIISAPTAPIRPPIVSTYVFVCASGPSALLPSFGKNDSYLAWRLWLSPSKSWPQLPLIPRRPPYVRILCRGLRSVGLP